MGTNEKFFWVVKFPVNDGWHDDDSATWIQSFHFFGTAHEAFEYFTHPEFFSIVAKCQNPNWNVTLVAGAESVECLNAQGVRSEADEKWLFSKVGVIFEWDEEVLSAFGSK
ncbi:MAG: hypothetical protein QG654_531 [Patescibacteria group bacterium]|nr:hypothetical protein [Patescibacteria group bacterium]